MSEKYVGNLLQSQQIQHYNIRLNIQLTKFMVDSMDMILFQCSAHGAVL